MVNERDLAYIVDLITNCIESESYNASRAFSDLNHYLSKLRKEYKETHKDVSD